RDFHVTGVQTCALPILTGGKIAFLVSADMSLPMVSCAPGPRIAANEEALPFANSSLNLVTSILSLHAVNDLPGTLVQIRRALKRSEERRARKEHESRML